MSKVALQADVCYNEARNIVVPGGAVNTPGRIHLWRNVPMTTLPPHVDNGNIPSTSGIYKITCTANKKIYIGSAVNLQQRKKGHFSCLRRNEHVNKHLQNAWNKYGEQTFIFEVLEYVLPMSLTAREQYWFKKLKPFDRKGFNIAREAGSTLGYKYAPETIEKMRGMKRSPEARVNISRAALGRKRSAESIEKSRQGNLGKKQPSEAIEKTRQAQLGHMVSPETREKLRQARLGKKRSPESVKKSADGHRGMKKSPETRERMRLSGFAAWQRRKEQST